MIRKSVQNLKPYTPGEQPKISNIVKLNTNENAYPPSPKVAAALRDFAANALNLYPDPLCVRIREHLAKLHGCEADDIFVGNGSDEVLRLATGAWVENDGAIGFFNPSYSLYPVLAAIREALGAEAPEPPPERETAPERVLRLTGVDVTLCPVCKAGRLSRVGELPRARDGPS